MKLEVKTAPFHRKLIGLAGKRADGQCFGDAGKALMHQLWPALESMSVEHHGVMHWVYDSMHDLFVGVEPTNEGMEAPEGVEYRYINSHRRLEYLHVGSYDELPDIWEKLLAEAESLKETRLGPDMEIYDHHSDDPKDCQTTIMIGLLGDE